MNRKWILRNLLITAGTLAAFMGILGIFLPVLPTTPFLLLAAFCYVRSSPKLYQMLLNNKICGLYLKNYLEQKGMILRYKILTLAFLWIVMGITIVFATESRILRIILGLVASGVTIHILTIRTLTLRVENETNTKEK
jgi:uncharacterized membrane protein YbaN (DUF454 family)